MAESLRAEADKVVKILQDYYNEDSGWTVAKKNVSLHSILNDTCVTK